MGVSLILFMEEAEKAASYLCSAQEVVAPTRHKTNKDGNRTHEPDPKRALLSTPNETLVPHTATAEAYFFQLFRTREFCSIGHATTKLDSKIKTLQSKINDLGQGNVQIIEYHQLKMLDMATAHEKVLREQKEAHILASSE
ncbi:hypothetical protein AgCh_018214 [Apium graveolens]